MMRNTERTNRPVALYNGDATCCRSSNDRFARSVVESIIRALPTRTNWGMCIDAATPPYERKEQLPAGHIEITLFVDGHVELPIGIVFGATGEAGRVLRQPFDPESWAANPYYSWSSGLVAINFDEAWRIVTLLAVKLHVMKIEICYGLGM